MSNIVFVAESMCVSGKEQVTYVPLRIAVSSPLKSPLVNGASLRRHAPSKLAACSGHEIICVSKSFAKTAQNSKNATVACTNEAKRGEHVHETQQSHTACADLVHKRGGAGEPNTSPVRYIV